MSGVYLHAHMPYASLPGMYIYTYTHMPYASLPGMYIYTCTYTHMPYASLPGMYIHVPYALFTSIAHPGLFFTLAASLTPSVAFLCSHWALASYSLLVSISVPTWLSKAQHRSCFVTIAASPQTTAGGGVGGCNLPATYLCTHAHSCPSFVNTSVCTATVMAI